MQCNNKNIFLQILFPLWKNDVLFILSVPATSCPITTMSSSSRDSSEQESLKEATYSLENLVEQGGLLGLKAHPHVLRRNLLIRSFSRMSEGLITIPDSSPFPQSSTSDVHITSLTLSSVSTNPHSLSLSPSASSSSPSAPSHSKIIIT